MKKLVFTLCLLASVAFIINAQEGEEENDGVLKGKKGTPVLPETGDYAISFNAVPILDFGLNVINIMNNTGQKGQTSQHPGYVDGMTNIIVGKYFLDDETAVKVKFGWNTTNNKKRTFYDTITTGLGSALSDEELENSVTQKNSDILIGVGMEKRRGYGRLQGTYGGELIVGFNSNTVKNSYGWDLEQQYADSGIIAHNYTRTLSTKTGTTVRFGVRGFVGVEYFFAPKMSIGAEFGWMIGLISQPRGSVEIEKWEDEDLDGQGSSLEEELTGSTKERDFNIGVDNGIDATGGRLEEFNVATGVLTLTVHF